MILPLHFLFERKLNISVSFPLLLSSHFLDITTYMYGYQCNFLPPGSIVLSEVYYCKSQYPANIDMFLVLRVCIIFPFC